MRALPALLLLAACAEPMGSDALDSVIDVDGVRFERMFLTTGEGGRFGGFDEAVTAGDAVSIRIGDRTYDAVGDENGRFDLDVEVRADQIAEVSAGGVVVSFAAREPSVARVAAVRGPIGGTGDLPNDLRIVDGPRGPRGILVRSADHAISEFDLVSGLGEGAGVRLPRVDDQPATPWFVTPLDETGVRFAVTAQSQHLVYVVDLMDQTVEHALAVDPIPLAAPFELSRPKDFDGDGEPESTITEAPALAPQPVLVADGHLLVAFSGFAEHGDSRRPPIFVPAVLAVWPLDALESPAEVYPLGAMNPQELRRREDGRVYVVCSGVVDLQGGAHTTTAGSIEVFDLPSRTFVESYDFGLFGPTTALFASGRVWAGSLSTATIETRNVADPTDVTSIDLTGVDEVNSVFRLVDLGGGLIAAPTFNRDAMFLLDTRTHTVNPPPFFEPLIVGAGAPVFDGLQIVARRPGRIGVDFVGPDLYALSGLAARVTAIELRRILGP